MNELQDRIAQLTGHESALFCVSGTLSNQVIMLAFGILLISNQLAIRTHLTAPPYSVLCHHQAHVYKYEAAGISFHCGIIYSSVILCADSYRSGAGVIPVKPTDSGNLTVNDIKKHAILDEDIHYAPTRLVCIENTLNGEVLFPFGLDVSLFYGFLQIMPIKDIK